MRTSTFVIIALALFSVVSVSVAQIPRPMVGTHYSCMESGQGDLSSYNFYYWLYHSGTSTTSVKLRNKLLQRTENSLKVNKQIAAADSLDSVTVRRALELEFINLWDKSATVAAEFTSIDKNRLESVLKEFSKNVSRIPVWTDRDTKNLWDARYNSVRQGMNIAATYRMSTIDRKKCYINLYNDAVKFNRSLCNLLSYLTAMDTVKSVGSGSVRKLDKTSYKNYACARWKLAYHDSMKKGSPSNKN